VLFTLPLPVVELLTCTVRPPNVLDTAERDDIPPPETLADAVVWSTVPDGDITLCDDMPAVELNDIDLDTELPVTLTCAVCPAVRELRDDVALSVDDLVKPTDPLNPLPVPIILTLLNAVRCTVWVAVLPVLLRLWSA